MLGSVSLSPRAVAQYEPVVGSDAIADLRQLARRLRGRRILNLSVSAFGTWHTDLLGTTVPLLQDLGLQAGWGIVRPSHRAERAVDALYAALAGTGSDWDAMLQRDWEEFAADSRSLLDGDSDIIIVHDPQLLNLAPPAGEPMNGRRVFWIWQSHLDLTNADPTALASLTPFVDRYDAIVFEDPAFVPAEFAALGVTTLAPALDPLGPRNVPLDASTAALLVERLGVRADRPLISQISPLTPGSDALGLIQAFDALKPRFPELQLAIVPTVMRDDERTRSYFGAVSRLAREREDCLLVPVASEVGNAELNALQQLSQVVVQKSLERGYALWLSEAMWKRRPVVAGRTTGTVAQIVDGVTGYLVPDTQSCIERLGMLLQDESERQRLGETARSHVASRFLITRYLADLLELLRSLTDAEGQ